MDEVNLSLKIDSTSLNSSAKMLDILKSKLDTINAVSKSIELADIFDKDKFNFIVKSIDELKIKLEKLSIGGNLENELSVILKNLTAIKINLDDFNEKLNKVNLNSYKDHSKTIQNVSSSMLTLAKDFTALSKAQDKGEEQNKAFNKSTAEMKNTISQVSDSLKLYSGILGGVSDSIEGVSNSFAKSKISEINKEYEYQKNAVKTDYKNEKDKDNEALAGGEIEKIQSKIDELNKLANTSGVSQNIKKEIENIADISSVKIKSIADLGALQSLYSDIQNKSLDIQKQIELENLNEIKKQLDEDSFIKKLEMMDTEYEYFLEKEQSKLDFFEQSLQIENELKIENVQREYEVKNSELENSLKNETNLQKRRQIEEQIEKQKAQAQQKILDLQSQKQEKLKQEQLKVIQEKEEKEKQLKLQKDKEIALKFEKENHERLELLKKEIELKYQAQKDKEQGIRDIQKAKQKEIEKTKEADYQNKLLEIEYKRQVEIAKVKRSQEIAQKTVDIAKASANTALAITRTFAELGAIGGAIATPIMLGTLGAQIGAIASSPLTEIPSKPERIALAKGGIVPRVSGGINAIIGEGDSDELVLPLTSQNIKNFTQNILNTETNKPVFSPIFNVSINIENQNSNISEKITDELIEHLDKKLKDYNESIEIRR